MKEMVEVENRQRELCARYGSNFVSAPPDSILGIALETLGKFPVNGLRHPPEKGTSGWYIWCGESLDIRPDFFAPLRVSHLIEKCPVSIPSLGLPPGSRFLLGEKGYEDVWFDATLWRVCMLSQGAPSGAPCRLT
jgi:hypothetical protein